MVSMPAQAMLVIVVLISMLFQRLNAAENDRSGVRCETLLRSSASWGGEPYKSYPSRQPELSILKIIVPRHTTLEWHSHPMPSAAYIVSGELTLEKEKRWKEAAFCRWTGGRRNSRHIPQGDNRK